MEHAAVEVAKAIVEAMRGRGLAPSDTGGNAPAAARQARPRVKARSPQCPAAVAPAQVPQAQEEQPDAGDQRRRRRARAAGPPASATEARGDAGEVEQPGRDHEADAVGERVRRLGQLGAVGMAVKDREGADQYRSDPERRAQRERHHGAERHRRERDARLDPGSGTPSTPARPPNAITTGNTTGRSQIAGCPRNAPHRPTATIATT